MNVHTVLSTLYSILLNCRNIKVSNCKYLNYKYPHNVFKYSTRVK